MSTQQILPQNGLRVGEQIVAEGDNLSLGYNVGVKNDLTVGGSVVTNRVITPFVSKEHVGYQAITIDCSYQDHRIVLRTNALGLSFINVPPASQGTFRVKVYLIQDTYGNKVVDFSPSTSIVWTNPGPNPNTAPIYPVLQTFGGRVDVFEFITFDGGVNWVGSQVNPTTVNYNSFTDVLYALGASTNGSAPIMPSSYPGSSVIPNFSGTVVQSKTAVNSNILTFGNSSSTPIDVVTMIFTPKYKNSRLLISGQFTTSASGGYPTDFSVRGHFTIGTNPISTGLLLNNATNQFYYDVYPNQVDRQQVAHFGGYYYGMNSNFHIGRHSQIYYDHNVPAGTGLDLRIRAVHADVWSARSCSIGTSWTGTSNGAGSYTCQVPSSLTVMEILV